ncbi:RloB family protein [Chitinophaga sp. CF118]|uniref:RloB family protein n=1 Tax=Chitinophaga sp. CF118 TaxID=1884367 RepID=UPI0015A4F54D|nr:RloB family protein [Chitinophaga sp. CF118]
MGYYRKPRPRVSFLKRGLILCEGETEELYFKGLTTKEEYRRQFAAINVEIYKPKDHSPRGLVTEAKAKMKAAKKDDPYDFVWIVFDLDGHANVADTFEQALTSRPPIRIAFTAKCFEYFVLLHFVRTTKSFAKCDDIIADVKEHLPDYQKATDIFSTLIPFMTTGLANSEWSLARNQSDLDGGRRPYQFSAYSNIHELVNYLLDLIKLSKTETAVAVAK